MTSLISACLQVKSGAAPPIVHFRVLNPHLEQSGFFMFINNELAGYRFTQANTHVSSFGFGGTNGHAIIWGQCDFLAGEASSKLAKLMMRMAPPEVRVNGSDPSEWEWDGPNNDLKPGERYVIHLSPDGTKEPIRYVKEEAPEEQEPADLEEEDYYSISGPLNEWGMDTMEDGTVPGMHTIVVEVPSGGAVEFQFVKNNDPDKVICPEKDGAIFKTTPILGPGQQSEASQKNVWKAEAEEGTMLQIDLFTFKNKYGVVWFRVPDE